MRDDFEDGDVRQWASIPNGQAPSDAFSYASAASYTSNLKQDPYIKVPETALSWVFMPIRTGTQVWL